MKALALGIAILGTFVVAQAGDLRAEISAANQQICVAMKNKDMKTLEKLLTEGTTKNFVYVENGQKQDFKTMLANMKMGLGMMEKLTKVETKLLTLKQNGNTAVGTMQHSMTGIMTNPQDKKKHTMGFSGVATETYVKEGGKWKMSKMVWGKQTMTMDGKPSNGMGG